LNLIMTTSRSRASRPSPKRLGLVALIAIFNATAAHAASPPELPPLTTASGNPRLPGKFVWADLVTDDVAAARRFYGSLFRWSFRDYGGYVIAANDERPLCGIFQRTKPQDQPQAKPRWIGYLSVPNIKRAQRAVTAGGGRVIAAPQKFPNRGEQAIFTDPEGAVFGVIRSSAGDPEDFMADPGDWIWMQLLTRDGRKASEFYQEIAGYDILENTAAGSLSDYVLSSDGYARATVRTIPARMEQVRPAWLPFVRVSVLAEAVAQVERLGGTVLLAPNATVFDGKVAAIADPTGAAIGLIEWNEDLVPASQQP
jgi:predicted enzyme related to lactoylglutathione lyase